MGTYGSLTSLKRFGWALGLALVLGGPSAGCKSSRTVESSGDKPADAGVPWAPRVRAPTPPQGMLWIPPGVLIAGTVPGHIPRVADEEMPGEEVELNGFFIDRYAFPNEEGAIPKSGATYEQAGKMCQSQGKRLCSELEWERACKGPRNTVHEYGDEYREEPCLTGRAPRMLPSGYRTECRSEFGVRDMHGGVWEWTASEWGRGTSKKLYALRGGNGADGALVGRCANGIGKVAQHTSSRVGFRCCQGDLNTEEVHFEVEHGPALRARSLSSNHVGAALEAIVPEEVQLELKLYGRFEVLRVWNWRPVGNEELVVGTGCAGKSPRRRCGVLVATMPATRAELIGWMWVGKFPPVAKVKRIRRRLWVYGGDRVGHFKRAMWFDWGRMREGELVRNKPN